MYERGPEILRPRTANNIGYSMFRFNFSALKIEFPGYCAIHSAENPELGRKNPIDMRRSLLRPPVLYGKIKLSKKTTKALTKGNT